MSEDFLFAFVLAGVVGVCWLFWSVGLPIMKNRAEDFWESPGVTALTPWANPSLPPRQCPRMTCVQDEASDGVKHMFWVACGIIFLWAGYIPFALSTVGKDPMPVLTVGGTLGFFTYNFACALTKAVRAERIIFVSADPTVCGLHDDWPEEAGQSSSPDAQWNENPQPKDDDERVHTIDDDDVEVFRMPGEDGFYDDQAMRGAR